MYLIKHQLLLILLPRVERPQHQQAISGQIDYSTAGLFPRKSAYTGAPGRFQHRREIWRSACFRTMELRCLAGSSFWSEPTEEAQQDGCKQQKKAL